jgi:hypothetical protein
LRDDVFQFHTPPLYATGLDIRCPCEKIWIVGCWRFNATHL